MIRKTLVGLALLAGSFAGPARLLGADGEGISEVPSEEQFLRVWSVQLTPDESGASAGRYPFKDHMLFEGDGYFTAEAFGPLGFGRSTYTVTPLEGGAMGFTTTMSNGTQGTLTWNGVLQSNQLVGTLVWAKPDGTVGTYTFTATQEE